MKGEVHIPHSSMRLQNGGLKNDQAEKDFAREMTHELRTPLNVIIGLCQYLERDQESPLTEKQHETVIRMERNAHALLESVNHLLQCVRSGNYK